MDFIKITSLQPVVDYVVETLARQLGADRSVLWLVSGGSCVALAVAVADQLRARKLPRPRLTVSLVDERWGPPGHADSNWQQLLDAGFSLPRSILLPVLTGASRAETARTWEARLDTALGQADDALGLFGIGADGHTAGILPRTPAVTAETLVTDYDGGRYRRLTITAPTIARLSEAVVYAVGEAKWPVLDNLQHDQSPAEQPAQLLKAVPKLIIFNDHRGERYEDWTHRSGQNGAADPAAPAA